MSRRRWVVSALCLVLLTPSSAHAICVIMPLNFYLTENDFAVVFRGTVRDVTAKPDVQIVTFDVERVWKGRVSRTLMIMNHYTASENSESVAFVRGQHYLVFLSRLSPEQRVRFGVDASILFGTDACDAWPADGNYAKSILGTAAGSAPEAD